MVLNNPGEIFFSIFWPKKDRKKNFSSGLFRTIFYTEFDADHFICQTQFTETIFLFTNKPMGLLKSTRAYSRIKMKFLKI